MNFSGNNYTFASRFTKKLFPENRNQVRGVAQPG